MTVFILSQTNRKPFKPLHCKCSRIACSINLKLNRILKLKVCAYDSCILAWVWLQFNSIQFNSIQFNSIQFNSIQFNSIQFNTDICTRQLMNCHIITFGHYNFCATVDAYRTRNYTLSRQVVFFRYVLSFMSCNVMYCEGYYLFRWALR